MADAYSSGPMPRNRTSAFFKLMDVETADKRRVGLERLIEKGLLHELLSCCCHDDLVFLAMTCVFFRKEVSKLYTSNFRRCLKPFLDHTALFIGLVNATRALISGEILLDVLMGRKLPGGDYQMTLCVDNKLTAFTLMHHLVSIEGYSYMHDPCQPTIVDMCSAIHKKARSSPNVFDKHAYRPAVSSAKAIHSIHKSVDGNNVHIDVHSFEVASSHYQLTSTSGPRKPVWLIYDTWKTAYVNAMTMDRLTVYYPDDLFDYEPITCPLANANESPKRQNSSVPFHSTKDRLKAMYGIIECGGADFTYYTKDIPYRPASLPVDLLSLARE